MTAKEMAEIIATMRMMGSKLPAKEIIETYQREYQAALDEIANAHTLGKVTTIKRPF